MKIFLDIGAHDGETLKVVTEARWGFDRIYSFEPAPSCWSKIEAASTPAVELCRFGLWDQDTTLTLHNAGSIGASVSEDKEPTGDAVECEFRDAGRWFTEHLDPNDTIYAKINVEGAEAELVRHLAHTGTLGYIDHLLIHFDVRKVPSKRHLEDETRTLLDAAGVEYLPADEIQFGVVGRGTANWLRWCEANPATRDLWYRTIGRQIANVRRVAYPIKRSLVGG